MLTSLLIALVALLAFANGSNDNSKGVATLVGFGAATPRAALAYATATTMLGAMLSFGAAGGLIKAFSTGLFTRGTHADIAFFVAVLAGAVGWVIFATYTGLPVSTTHAIFGALVGAGLVVFGHGTILWGFLLSKFVLPLVISPIVGIALTYAVGWPTSWLVRRTAGRCVCVAEETVALAMTRSGAAVIAEARGGGVVVDEQAACDAAGAKAIATSSAAANAVHWTACGLVGFARGWNDAPKIAALGLIGLTAAHGTFYAFVIVAVAMALGGLIAGQRVLQTLAKKLTVLPLPESLSASLTTATLVGLASWNGLPVSTTHVATGGLVGAGLRHDPKAVRWGKVGEILLSWVVTLPVAGVIAAGVAAAIARGH